MMFPNAPLLVACAAVPLALTSCEKQQPSNGNQSDSASDQSSSGNSGAGDESQTDHLALKFEAIHELTISLIRQREFSAAGIAIEHLEELRGQVAQEKEDQIEALRAALAAARSAFE